MRSNLHLMSFAIVLSLFAISPQLRAQSPAQNASARALFIEGRDLWDDGKFADAERKFREALTRYPKADQSDRTTYYLITTLIKLGRTAEARSEIQNFDRTYPQSTWKSDVEEKRLTLNEFPAGVFRGAYNSVPWVLPAEPAYAGRFVVRAPVMRIAVAPTNASLEQEVIRIIVLTDADQGIAMAKERLRVNPSDPAVVSNFSTIASVGSPQAFPFFVLLAGNGPVTPNTQTQALFWIGRLNNDKDAVGKGLVEMMKEKDAIPTVADVLSRSNLNASRNVLSQIVQNPSTEKLVALERMFKSTVVHPFRSQIVESAGSIPDMAARDFLTDVAKNERELSVRLTAIQTLSGRKDVDVKTLEEILRTLPRAAPVPARAEEFGVRKRQ